MEVSESSLSDVDFAALAECVDKGLAAERQITKYIDRYLTAINLNPPSDAVAHERDQSTCSDGQLSGRQHPCSDELTIDWSACRDLESYSARLNACQRHICVPSYYKAKESCRFPAPWPF
jgi:hypothetical protein